MTKSNKSSKEQKPSKMRQKIHDMCEENEYLSIAQNRNRARSITVGTAFGGVVEINMRSDIASVYSQMQPTEAIELIEQLAAGVGVEIAMRPKNDFASWRGWEEVIDSKISIRHASWKGAAAWQLPPEELEPKKLESAKEEESKAELEPAAEEEKPKEKDKDKSKSKEDE